MTTLDPYPILRTALFCMGPELAHELSLKALQLTTRPGKPHILAKPAPVDPVTVMGLPFPNRIGLAAGLDKNGDFIDALGSLGFGFLELGTVTPLPQPGNPRPRLFRLPRHKAIINRMGFNNKGVEHLVQQVKKSCYQGILGLNIGKNFDTPIERAVDDYVSCMRAVYSVADYIAINISSPNTSNLRTLQSGGELERLLSSLKKCQGELIAEVGESKPIAVKIAPDLELSEIEHVAKVVERTGIDAVIATNTTISRQGVEHDKHGKELGGLSGAPLTEASTRVIAALRGFLRSEIPIIGVGGIMSAEDAAAKIKAGASLIQIYSGFIYRGPALIQEIQEKIGSVLGGKNRVPTA